MKLHQPEHCLALAIGWDRAKDRVDQQVEALFAVTHALAKTGQIPRALADVDRAHTALTADAGDEVPFWALV